MVVGHMDFAVIVAVAGRTRYTETKGRGRHILPEADVWIY